jgi:adenylate cyclase
VTHFFARLGIDSGDPLRHQALRALITDIAISICFVFCVNFFIRIRTLIGGKTLVRLMLGHYRRPLWEEKVFLFVDIVNSTGITQTLGSGKAQSLFTEYFADIDETIHIFCGEIHRYLGDEVVVTWPLNDVDSAIAAVEQIGIKLRDRTSYYSETYGIVPKFRAGVHGGEIVSGKVGNDRKKEIVFFGDTINTTARLTALSGELGVDVLVSERMVKYLKKPYAVLTPLGAFQLRGISNPMGVYQFAPQTWK